MLEKEKKIKATKESFTRGQRKASTTVDFTFLYMDVMSQMIQRK